MWNSEEYIHQDEFERTMNEKDTEIALLREVVQDLEIDIDHLTKELKQLHYQRSL